MAVFVVGIWIFAFIARGGVVSAMPVNAKSGDEPFKN
jgi:hypothetical protein